MGVGVGIGNDYPEAEMGGSIPASGGSGEI